MHDRPTRTTSPTDLVFGRSIDSLYSLNRKVSYQYLLRLEAYKLKKHLLTGEAYEPFERWW